MKKCEKCGKPLTEFESTFHREAASPSNISGKCWTCSKAENTFDKARIDKPNHFVEIFTCILGVALMILFIIPGIPYLDEPATTPELKIYSSFIVAAYILIGCIISFVVLSRRKPKKDLLRHPLDPPESRYHTSYGLDKTQYVSKERYDGAIVTEKVTYSGTQTTDQWNWDGSPSNVFERVGNAYASIFVFFMRIIVYLLAGLSFIVWVLPYVVVVIARDGAAGKYRAKIPRELRRAYKKSRAQTNKAPLTYRDKVGFLVSRSNPARVAPTPKRDSFLDSFSGEKATPDARYPFFYTYKNGSSFMIIDYHKIPSSDYGVSFVLVKEAKGDIVKKIVIGDEYAEIDSDQWQTEWKEAGATAQTLANMRWYEDKFNSILSGNQKKKEIVG